MYNFTKFSFKKIFTLCIDFHMIISFKNLSNVLPLTVVLSIWLLYDNVLFDYPINFYLFYCIQFWLFQMRLLKNCKYLLYIDIFVIFFLHMYILGYRVKYTNTIYTHTLNMSPLCVVHIHLLPYVLYFQFFSQFFNE